MAFIYVNRGILRKKKRKKEKKEKRKQIYIFSERLGKSYIFFLGFARGSFHSILLAFSQS